MLTATHRQLLQRDPYNVHVWHVEQYEHEAVWIPGGCAHQVSEPSTHLVLLMHPLRQHECEATWILDGCTHQDGMRVLVSAAARRFRVALWRRSSARHDPGPCNPYPNRRHAFPLQVRNLRSSIKVALDFVSPDAVAECLELRGEFRWAQSARGCAAAAAVSRQAGCRVHWVVLRLRLF